ncbi:helix-turn-helix transcriptional regulator [Paenibacillaceae sp. P-4]|uniref:helix-turn-helix domain-containing protein n=1 Tax=Paenibacillaceae bacterium P-4 TaxID=3160969 RepID=UPI0032E83BD3
MIKINQFVGSRIRSLRMAQGLTQEQLGELVDLPQPYVGGIERGERNITLETLQKIINALKVSPEELFLNYQDNGSSNEFIEIMNRLQSQLIARDIKEVKAVEKLVSVWLDTMDSLK